MTVAMGVRQAVRLDSPPLVPCPLAAGHCVDVLYHAEDLARHLRMHGQPESRIAVLMAGASPVVVDLEDEPEPPRPRLVTTHEDPKAATPLAGRCVALLRAHGMTLPGPKLAALVDGLLSRTRPRGVSIMTILKAERLLVADGIAIPCRWCQRMAHDDACR